MDAEIKVFTSDGWGPCHMVKVYLSRKGISFTEHNISEDSEGLKLLLDMGYRTTPVAVIGDERVVGYNPRKLDEALEAAGVSWPRPAQLARLELELSRVRRDDVARIANLAPAVSTLPERRTELRAT